MNAFAVGQHSWGHPAFAGAGYVEFGGMGSGDQALSRCIDRGTAAATIESNRSLSRGPTGMPGAKCSGSSFGSSCRFIEMTFGCLSALEALLVQIEPR
jgi:hypothetical protein